MMYETDHHVTVDGIAKVFRTYDEAESAAAARVRGRDKLKSAETLAGTDFRYECGMTVEVPGIQKVRAPILRATK